MELLMNFLENEHVENHFLGLVGSYSWANTALPALPDFAKRGSWKLVEPYVEALCAPTQEVLKQCEDLGKNLAQSLDTAP